MRLTTALAALIVLLPITVWIYGRHVSPQPAAQPPATQDNLLADLGIEPSQERTPAPGFLLNDSDGNVVRLDDLRGKVVLLNFWATWCPPCRLEMPSLEALHRQLGPRGLAVLSVGTRDNAGDVRSFINEHRLPFPALLDPGAHAYGAYEIWSLPTSFVIDKRGYLVGKVVGHRDWTSEQSKDFFLHLLEAQLTSLNPNQLLVSALMPLQVYWRRSEIIFMLVTIKEHQHRYGYTFEN